MTLATLSAERFPQLRQVVLREVVPEDLQLLFYTDPRSPKWQQLKENPLAEVLFWDPSDKLQLRCQVFAHLHQGDALALAHQEAVPQHLAGDYAALTVPGRVIADPAEGQSLAEDWSFGVVVLTVTQMDWLQLDREGHRRARFQWPEGGVGESTAQWIQP